MTIEQARRQHERRSGRPVVHARQRAADERGAALVVAILIAALMTAVASALITTSTIETLIGAAHKASQETSDAAEAAAERAIRALSALPDWSLVLTPPPANLLAPFDDGNSAPVAPDGRRLDLSRLASTRQSASNTFYGPAVFGADSPQWRLYGHAPLGRLIPPGLAAQKAYLLVWVADDGGDGDGDPAIDANGQVMLYAEAFGQGGAHRAIEIGLGRSGPGVVRLLAWKQTR